MKAVTGKLRPFPRGEGLPHWLRAVLLMAGGAFSGLLAICLALFVLAISTITPLPPILERLLSGWQRFIMGGTGDQSAPAWLIAVDAAGVLAILGFTRWRIVRMSCPPLSLKGRMGLVMVLSFAALSWHVAVRGAYWTSRLPHQLAHDVRLWRIPDERLLHDVSTEAGPLLSRPHEPIELWRQSSDLKTLASPRPTPLGNWIVLEDNRLQTLTGAEYQAWLANRRPFSEAADNEAP